jgi:hypothetical protein
MWYRITLKLSNGEIRSGIREVSHENLYRVELMVFEAVKKSIGLNRISMLDITPLSEDHPEVQALLKCGKDVQELK